MRNKSLAAALAFFLGGIGMHKFYLGRPGAGILYALFFWTFIPAILGLLEALSYISMSQEQFDKKYNALETPLMPEKKPTIDSSTETTLVICPYCKEEIKEGALKCKHCGSQLGTQNGKKGMWSEANTATKTVALFFLITVVGGFIFALSSVPNQSQPSQQKVTNQVVAPTSTIDYKIIWTKDDNRYDGAPKLWILIDTIDVSSAEFTSDIEALVRSVVSKRGGKITLEIFDDIDALNVMYKQYGDLSLGRVRTENEDALIARHLIAYYSGEDMNALYFNELSYFPGAFSDHPVVGKYAGSNEFNP